MSDETLSQSITNYSETNISKDDMERIQATLLTGPDAVQTVVLFPNFKPGAEILKDFATTVVAEKPVNPNNIPERLFSVCAIYEIETTKELENNGDVFFQKRVNTKQNFGDMFDLDISCPNSGPSLGNIFVNNCPSDAVGKSKQRWNPSLGEKGYWGITKSESGDKYYIALYASNNTLSREIKELVRQRIVKQISERYSIERLSNDSSVMTFGDLSSDKIVTLARNQAIINANRCAVVIASKLGVRIKETPTTEVLKNTDGSHVTVGTPVAMTFYGDMINRRVAVEGTVRDVREFTVFANGASFIENSMGLGSVVPKGPTGGIGFYKQTGTKVTTEVSNILVSPTITVSHQRQLQRNEKVEIMRKLHWDSKSKEMDFDDHDYVPEVISNTFLSPELHKNRNFLPPPSLETKLNYVVGYVPQ